MTLEVFIFLIGGLILLTIGADVLIKGASNLASMFGVSALVVGLTVVAFGTSAPELAVSIKSALNGQADIAIGNVVGSNICNIWFILGLCAVVSPLVIHSQIVKIEVPIMISVSFLFYLFSLDHVISRNEGVLLVSSLLVYLYFTFSRSRKESQREKENREKENREKENRKKESSEKNESDPNALNEGRSKYFLINLIKIVIGLTFLIVGSDLFVSGATDLARAFNVSELIIGLTIVAIGTSLPEAVTSVVATYRGERDIAIGNVVGSNIFNILTVIGFSSIITPISVSQSAINFDLIVMLVVAIMCLPFFFDSTLTRWRGLFFLLSYCLYVFYLAISSDSSSGAPGDSHLIGLLIKSYLPVLFVISAVMVIRKLRKDRSITQS